MQVTVQAGARIQDVVDQLRPHGLTLQNFASIREQSVGGFTQVPPAQSSCLCAHGCCVAELDADMQPPAWNLGCLLHPGTALRR